MSTYRVEVVSVSGMEKHPNADSLSIIKVFGFTAIVNTEDFRGIDRAAYVPVDSMVDVNQPEFSFLRRESEGPERIKARRLRGIYSEGLLAKPRPHWNVGDDVASELGCRPYEPPEPMSTNGDNESQPGWFHIYTDIENLRRYPDKLQEGEEVVIIEKLHGANMRLSWKERLWVGSHRNAKRQSEESIWWKCSVKNSLIPPLQRLAASAPDRTYIVHGEVYGQVQDLKYGAGKNDLFFGLFDISVLDLQDGRYGRPKYLDYDEMVQLAEQTGLAQFLLPVLYRGPWTKDLMSLANGNSQVPGANHMKEGFVVRPVKEREDLELGRVILKVVGEDYRLRKGGTERH